MNPALLPNGDEFLLLPEVAGMLRCSVKSIRRMIQDGKLKSCKIRGRVLVPKSALLACVNSIMSDS